MANHGYQIGKLAGQHAGKICVAVLAASVAIGFFTNTTRPQALNAGAAGAQSSQVAASAPVEKPDPCQTDRPARLQSAIALLKENKFDASADLLYVCIKTLTKDEKAIYAKALTAGNAARAKVADAEARAIKAEKKRQGVRIGMSGQDVLDSSWGRPEKVNRTTTQRGVREQWVYHGNYLYFEDGVLTTIQN